MISAFKETWVKDIAEGIASKKALKNLPSELHPIARIKLHLIHIAGNISDLKVPPGNKLKKLQGERSGEWAIRINDQWRITFKYDSSTNTFSDVLIEDYH